MNIPLRFMQKFYAFFVVCALPLLYLYIIPGTDILWSQVVLIAMLVVLFFYIIRNPRIHIDSVYLPFLIFIIVQSLGSALAYKSNALDLLFTVGQYCCYLVLLAFFNRELFNRNYLLRGFMLVGNITSIYLFVQQLIQLIFGIYLGAGILFLPVRNENIQTYGEVVQQWGLTYRPRSLFTEPAMYATFTLLALSLNLLYVNNGDKWKRVRTILYTVGSKGALFPKNCKLDAQ